MRNEFPAPQLLGTYRQFGAVGPAYQVLQPVRQLDDGDWIVSIQVMETGEKAEYRYTAVLDDPKAL